MKLYGIIFLGLLCTVLSLDWWVCYIKKECVPPETAALVEPVSEAEATVEIPVEPEVVESPEPTVIAKKDDKVEIIDNRIHFRAGAKNPLSSNVVKDYLAEMAKKWKKDPSQTFRIMGHTDYLGKRRHNYLLGLRRGQAVRVILMSYGVPKKKIKVNSSGEIKPIGNNKTKAGRFLNRRVEIRLK